MRVSGETVFLRDQNGDLAALVRAVAAVERDGLPPHALIGGLAVIVRLAKRHRATTDVDEVYLGMEGDAAQLLVDRGARRQPNGVILAGGTRVDLISVEDYDAADLPDEPDQRAFIVAHHWSLDTATPITLVVTDALGSVVAEATPAVASVPALVAMKLASAPNRRGPTEHKRATDLFDVFRLLVVHDVGGAISAELRGAPHDLALLVRDMAERLLIVEAERSVRWLLTSGGPEMEGVTAEDLRAVGEPLRAELDRA